MYFGTYQELSTSWWLIPKNSHRFCTYPMVALEANGGFNPQMASILAWPRPACHSGPLPRGGLGWTRPRHFFPRVFLWLSRCGPFWLALDCILRSHLTWEGWDTPPHTPLMFTPLCLSWRRPWCHWQYGRHLVHIHAIVGCASAALFPVIKRDVFCVGYMQQLLQRT